MFRKTDLFPSSGDGEWKTPTQLGPSERATISHWTKIMHAWKSYFSHMILKLMFKMRNAGEFTKRLHFVSYLFRYDVTYNSFTENCSVVVAS
jgi:hypothetical protein